MSVSKPVQSINARNGWSRHKIFVCALAISAAIGCKDSTSDGHAASTTGAAQSGGTDAGSASTGVVKLATGSVQGDLMDGVPVRRYLKIPYAKPPVGDLRWKPPAKPDAWTGVLHETEISTACAQNASSGSVASLNEDCLYLNVWQPDPKPAKAPVMIWIHGGGNFAGGANDLAPMTQQLWYDGTAFAQRHGLVVVTFNYRLGPLGFFGHKDLPAEGSNQGNQGLLDQHAVIEWVHDNIAAFGGDPTNVTIFGESAGSADVCYHVASPLEKGLFQHAISESGGCTAGMGVEATPALVAPALQDFAKALGCDTATDQLACLRGKPIDQIMMNANQPDPTSGGAAPPIEFTVLVDGANGFLPKSSTAIFDAGEMNKVTYMLGSNNDEGTLFLLGVTGPTTEADYAAQLKMRYGDFGTQVEALYPPSKFNNDPRAALARVIGDSDLVCGTHDSARRAAKAGLTVYMYNFNVPWAIAADALGASHASEISHVFGLPYMPDAGSQKVSDAMNAYWASFATTGDPNGAGAPTAWPKFAPDASDHDQRLQLDPAFEVVNDFRKDECAFWRMRYASAN
jgi:para-nitrobenzyl esterase